MILKSSQGTAENALKRLIQSKTSKLTAKTTRDAQGHTEDVPRMNSGGPGRGREGREREGVRSLTSCCR